MSLKIRGFRTRSTNKSVLQNTTAISEVLGALFIMAILLSASSIYLAQHLPAWTEEYEAEHAAAVPHDFATLEANIERAVLSVDPTTLTSTTVGMLPEGVLLIGMYPAGGTLSFTETAETFECIAGLLEEPDGAEDGYWNDTANWTYFDSFHVSIFSKHAELAPVVGEDMIIDKNESLSGEYYCDEFIVRNNSILTVEGRLKIHATSILLEAGSSITADGRGWSGGQGNAPGYNGSGVGGGKGGAEYKKEEDWGKGGKGGGGGGGGGDGGDGGGKNNESWSSVGGIASYAVDEMGAGGGGGGDYKDTDGQTEFSSGGNGGRGGGYIFLEAYNITLAGCISANGTDGLGTDQFKGGGGGGGADGGIIIKGDTVNITRMLYARGGNGGSSGQGHGGGGGGGGVIKVSCDDSIINGTKLDVSNGTGGTGTSIGDSGFLGIKQVHNATFNSSLSHYTSGYLVSNMTAVPGQGQIGYDTNSTRIRYGNLTYGPLPRPGTDIVLKVRTSMYPDMRDALPWEDCPPIANNTGISNLISVSDGHRYVQWRAELLTFDLQETPELHWVNISYTYGEPVLARTAGTIVYASQYLYYPNYNLIYAHGATIREQYGRAFMLFPPPLFIETHETGTALTITAIDVVGDASSVSGRMSATVQTAPQGTTLFKPGLNYADITLNLTTAYRSAWVDWFTATCGEAGLSKGTEPGQYNISYNSTTTPDVLQVIFYGNETKPVHLWLKHAEARVKLTK